MAVVYVRTKRVTGLLDDDARARLRGELSHRTEGDATSGSEHGRATCLSALVHAFLETTGDADDDESLLAAGSDGASSSEEGEDRDRAAAQVVRECMDPASDGDRFRLRLAADACSIKESLALLGLPAAALRRAVLARLRAAGYNAGVCRSRWETSGGLAGGSYEYLDVVAPAGEAEEGARYIVDLDFAAEFEVARATEGFRRVAAALPHLAVARPEAVRRVVRAVADAARRSLRSRGLHVPPWRKSRYMLARWLGPYLRTTNALPASAAGDVKCRSIGFSAPAANRPGEISLF